MTIRGADENVSIELVIDGRRVLHRSFDDEGRLSAIYRIDERGNGFSMAMEKGRMWNCCAYVNGKKEGMAHEYYRHKPQQIREEIPWHEGMRDGLARRWGEDGTPLSEMRYEQGFIAPVLRYRGAATTRPVASIYRTERGVFYTAHAKIDDLVKVGMSAQQVSEILKVDFSEAPGSHSRCTRARGCCISRSRMGRSHRSARATTVSVTSRHRKRRTDHFGKG